MDQKVRYPNKENKINKGNRIRSHLRKKKMAVLPPNKLIKYNIISFQKPIG